MQLPVVLVNVSVVCASVLEELWAGGFASGGVFLLVLVTLGDGR